MEHILIGSLLGYNTILDIRKREVSVVTILIYGIIGTILFFMYGTISIGSMIGGILIGCIILILHKITKDGIGIGDGYLVIVTGIYLGFLRNIYLIVIAMLLAACCSIILIIFKKANRKMKIPFVPFLLLSYIGMVIL